MKQNRFSGDLETVYSAVISMCVCGYLLWFCGSYCDQ